MSVIIQEGARFCSEIIRYRSLRPKQENNHPPSSPPAQPQEAQEEAAEESGEGKIEKGTACLPCTNSHLHACVGLLTEAHRMSPDGLNPESMKRVDKCLGEIAAAERVDLAVENVGGLPVDERAVADHATKELREIRHGLEGLNNKEELEQLTIQTTNLQRYVGKEWFKIRLSKMSPEGKEKLAKAAMEKLENE